MEVDRNWGISRLHPLILGIHSVKHMFSGTHNNNLLTHPFIPYHTPPCITPSSSTPSSFTTTVTIVIQRIVRDGAIHFLPP